MVKLFQQATDPIMNYRIHFLIVTQVLCKFEEDVTDLSQRVLCYLRAGLMGSSGDGRGHG